MKNTTHSIIECKSFLIQELTKRKAINPNFTLRAFALYLNISPAHLSALISGKRPLTQKVAAQIADRLGLSSSERMDLLKSMSSDLIMQDELAKMQVITEDEYKLNSDWHHLAVLSMGSLKNNKAHVKWIAKELGISEIMAMDALNRLKRMGLITVNSNGSFVQSSKPLQTNVDVPSEAIRNYHKQNLDLAKEKLETVNALKREFSSITMPVNPKNLARVKELMNEFKTKLSQELGIGEKTEVYTLAIQLFPLTRTQTDIHENGEINH